MIYVVTAREMKRGEAFLEGEAGSSVEEFATPSPFDLDAYISQKLCELEPGVSLEFMISTFGTIPERKNILAEVTID